MVYYYIYKTADGSFAYGSIDTSSMPSSYADADGHVPLYKASKYITDALGIDKVGPILYDEADAIAMAQAKNQALMGAAEINAMPDKDITGNVGVAKKGTNYAVLKVDSGHYWHSTDYYVVNVSNGTVVTDAYSLGDAKNILAELDAGYADPSDYAIDKVYGKTIELPPTVQKQQQQLNNPKPKKASPQKPIGSTAASVVSVEEKNGFALLHMDDGTYGVFVPSTGQYGFGYKSAKGAAKSANMLIKKTQQFQTMGIDNGVGGIGNLLGSYENRMRGAFQQAANEMAAKQARAMEKFIQKRDELLAKVANGTMTQAEYDAWLKSQNMTQKWYKDMVDSLSQDMVDADKKAMEMLNGYVPRAYAEGMNYGTFQIENDLNVNTGFNLYNESTVAHLISNPEGSLLPDLPEAKANELKDAVWSKQKINSCVTQSILQGESVPNAAKRLAEVVGMSANAAMRTARTTLACAENMGHYNAGLRAIGMGIKLVKLWRATYDARTRHSHRALDLEEAEAEKEFSNGLMYPADPNGEPSEVYNCRCRMRWIEPTDKKPEPPNVTKEGVAYDEWKNEKQLKAAAKQEKYQKQYDDINAQLNDLKSKLPPNKDFGKIVQGSNLASDWTPEKVASSEEYYFQKLQKAIAENNSYDIKWYKDRLAQLKEYDDAGRAYAEAHALLDPQIASLQEKADKAQQALVNAKKGAAAVRRAGGSYEQRRAATQWFASSKDADDALRAWTGNTWATSDKRYKRAINQYTGGSYEEYNRPLNGYNGWYDPSNFVGVGTADIDAGGFGGAIRDMTSYLQGSVTEQDMWLRRGEGRTSLAPFFGLPAGTDVTSLSEEQLRGFIGTSARIGSFQSCGTTASTGFTHKPVVIEYFVPAGSQAAYVEPFSRLGHGAGMNWDGVSPQSSLGGELETILQRGGSYTMVDFRYEGRKPVFVMEVHPEDGYWLFQQ